MIKIQNIETPFFIYKVENHQEIKKFILKEIANMGKYSFQNKGQILSNTDWHLGNNFDRKYLNVVGSVLMDHCKEIKNTYLQQSNYTIEIGSIWFQQYEYLDYHEWHYHGKCSFSNVYYVELPNDGAKTSFSLFGKEFELDVKEGQIITFPGCFMHCSKPNQSNERKTVISFNSNII
jgi:hypothetical protein